MTLDEMVKLAEAKGRVIRASAVDADFVVLDCGEATDANERGRMTADGAFLTVSEGRYWQVVPVDAMKAWLEGLK